MKLLSVSKLLTVFYHIALGILLYVRIVLHTKLTDACLVDSIGFEDSFRLTTTSSLPLFTSLSPCASLILSAMPLLCAIIASLAQSTKNPQAPIHPTAADHAKLLLAAKLQFNSARSVPTICSAPSTYVHRPKTCQSKPCYVENGYTHPFCGKRCAASYQPASDRQIETSVQQRPANCKRCKSKSVYIDEDGKASEYCSKACAPSTLSLPSAPPWLSPECGIQRCCPIRALSFRANPLSNISTRPRKNTSTSVDKFLQKVK